MDERRVALPAETEEGLRELVFRDRYRRLGEYLEGFRSTVAVLADTAALERVAYELCEDCFEEGVRYLEVRYAPQLHVRDGFEVADVVRAFDRGLRRAIAEQSRPCDRIGRGAPLRRRHHPHRAALLHARVLGGVSALGCSTRAGSRAPTSTTRSGTWRSSLEKLAQVVADKRITIEVCLSRRRLSTTFGTGNRLVSNMTVSQEIARAVKAFDLSPRAVRDSLIYGFKRSFFPGTYVEKRAYVRRVIDFADRVLREAGVAGYPADGFPPTGEAAVRRSRNGVRGHTQLRAREDQRCRSREVGRDTGAA
jgi:adenosine deaminase